MAKKKDKKKLGKKPLVIEHRDWLVSDYYLRGFNFNDIQTLLRDKHQQEVTHDQIRASLTRIRKYWRRQSIRKFELKTQMIAEQINLVYKDACEAWERSKLPTITDKYEISKEEAKDIPTTSTGVKEEMRLIERSIKTGSGDPQFLRERRECLRDICKLYGLDEPIRIESIRQIEVIEVNPISRQTIQQQAIGDRT